MKKNNYIVYVVGLLMLFGCAKDKPQKSILKEKNILSKSSFDSSLIGDGKGDIQYLFSVSTVSSSYNTVHTRPHWAAGEKVITFNVTKEQLQIVELHEDKSLQQNDHNNKILMTIPIDHVDYKCAEDSYGQCLSREVENSEISWKDKKYLDVNFTQTKFTTLSLIPEEIDNFYMSNCHRLNNVEVKSLEIDEESINFVLKKNYESNYLCADFNDGLNSLSFSVDHHYSFVKLNSVATAQFTKRPYETHEENTFGFFTTEKTKLSVDNKSTVDGKEVLMNHWSPQRQVDYYLSSSFNKPEYAKIKQTTYKAFNLINDGLIKSGSALRLNLKEPNAKVKPEDIRFSSIVLYEDPLSSGIIGYGPSTVNPLTGEIISAKTIMYLGTIKKTVQREYNNLAELKRSSQLSSSNFALDTSIVVPVVMSEKRIVTDVVSKKFVSGDTDQFVGPINLAEVKAYATKPNSVTMKTSLKAIPHIEGLDRQFTGGMKVYEKTQDFRQLLSKQNYFHSEMLNFQNILDKNIDGLLKKNSYKLWDELTTAQQKEVLDTVLPFVWLPTLIHEVGHNLGLRHNFSGSNDKQNFYTQKELTEMGLESDKEYKYSSVMDYGYQANNELQLMGKYDIAALRFAYAGKVEVIEGEKTQFVSSMEFHNNPELALKPYGFCTDDHVGANPTCNRFDEGTNLVEITNHLIKSYEKRYERANFRNKRLSFSLYDDNSYVSFINGTFSNLRKIFERYESIKNRFDLADDNELWETVPFLKEIKISTKVVLNFFIKVIKTPDVHCVVASSNEPTKIIALVPLEVLSKTAVSCLDKDNVQLREPYLVIGETGKSFKSKKSPQNDNPYLDQIDVRGIWIDKVIALHYLLTRKLGSPLFDEYSENYLNFPGGTAAVQNLYQELMMDEIKSTTMLKTTFGNVEIPFNHSHLDSQLIGAKMTRLPRKMMGVASGDLQFREYAIKTLAKQVFHRQYRDISSEAKKYFYVYASQSDYVQSCRDIGETCMSNLSSIMVYNTHIYALKGTLGDEMMALAKASALLQSVDANILKEFITAYIEAKTLELKEEVKSTYSEKLPVEDIILLKQSIIDKKVLGSLKASSYYSDSLYMMIYN